MKIEIRRWCLRCIPIIFSINLLPIPGASAGGDAQTQKISVGAGVKTEWSPFRDRAIHTGQGGQISPRGHGIDLELLRRLKNQPFISFDKQPTIEEDSSVSVLEPEPLAPNLSDSFEGPDNLNQPDGYLHRPPDPILAVGLNHIGVMVNSELAFYTKSGTLVREESFSSWWSNVYTGKGSPFDPRIIYDHHENRWIMVALVLEEPDAWYLLSVSQTSDPTGFWWNWKLDSTLNYGGEDTWADYPDIGFDGISSSDGGAIYLTTNQFTWAGSFRTSLLNVLAKSELYTGSSLSYYKLSGRTNEDGSQAFTLRTAWTHGNPGGEFLINSKVGGGDNVTFWKVVPAFPSAPIWTRQATISIGTYSTPPDAKQRGGSALLDTIGNRIYNCMYQNGYLYAAFTTAYDWGSGTVAAIRYLKINTSSNSAELDVTYGADGYYYWFPAIYVDHSDNMVIVFARSSETEYAGIRYTGRLTTDVATQSSAQLKSGETYITGVRWGDYFGIARDPNDGARVWIYGEWAKDCSGISSDWDWGTWIGQVEYACYVEPTGSCGGNTPCYSTIQAAIDAAGSGYTIKIAQGTYNEDLDLSSSKNLTLQGGWNSLFTSRLSTSTISSMTIGNSQGTVTTEYLVIQ